MEKNENIKTYIENILNSVYSNELIQKNLFDLKIIEEDGTEYDSAVITLDKLKYVQLVTKIETFIKVLDILKLDDNVVCSDAFLEDADDFIQRVKLAIENSIKNDEQTDII